MHSFTDPRENLFAYSDWLLDTAEGQIRVRVADTKVSGKHLIVRLTGVDDRDAAAALIGAPISVSRSALPPCEPGEYYWADLEGLEVRTPDGVRLGTVDRLFATGANDVLVLDNGRMIPFVTDTVVKTVDLDRREIVIDWDASYWE